MDSVDVPLVDHMQVIVGRMAIEILSLADGFITPVSMEVINSLLFEVLKTVFRWVRTGKMVS